MLRILAPLGALVFSAGACAQEVTTLVIAPSQEVRAGGSMTFEVIFLNSSTREAPWSFPGTLECRFVTESNVRSGTLELQPADSPVAMVLPPNGFGRRNYGLTVPRDVVGAVWMEVLAPGAQRILLDVRPIETPPPRELGDPDRPPAVVELGGPREPEARVPTAVDVFMQNIAPHEPFYFLAGLESSSAKFQISFKYRIFGTNWGWAMRHRHTLEDLYFGYTQTSLWDVRAASAPFVDSSYKPEILYLYDRVVGKDSTDRFRLDLQAGFKHESNGRDGADSRSLNIVYFSPKVTFGSEARLQFSLAPRAWQYVGGLEENTDLERYRGHFSVRSTLGWNNGFQLASEVFVGDDLDRGKLEVDLTHPFPWWLDTKDKRHRSYTMYLHLQFFTGYGESLLFYQERETQIRLGLALFR